MLSKIPVNVEPNKKRLKTELDYWKNKCSEKDSELQDLKNLHEEQKLHIRKIMLAYDDLDRIFVGRCPNQQLNPPKSWQKWFDKSRESFFFLLPHMVNKAGRLDNKRQDFLISDDSEDEDEEEDEETSTQLKRKFEEFSEEKQENDDEESST
jgi:hypothetical protein